MTNRGLQLEFSLEFYCMAMPVWLPSAAHHVAEIWQESFIPASDIGRTSCHVTYEGLHVCMNVWVLRSLQLLWSCAPCLKIHYCQCLVVLPPTFLTQQTTSNHRLQTNIQFTPDNNHPRRHCPWQPAVKANSHMRG